MQETSSQLTVDKLHDIKRRMGNLAIHVNQSKLDGKRIPSIGSVALLAANLSLLAKEVANIVSGLENRSA